MNERLLFAELRNGYERDIESVRRSLRGLTALERTPNLSQKQKQKIRERMRMSMEYISCYEITQNLLNEFKTIAPALYAEIAEIKDFKGRQTDVYVKLIPRDRSQVKAAGTTSLAHSAHDEHLYYSKYGNGTVLVIIWIINKALYVLAHELGHVLYQVPNLKSYLEFHKYNYGGRGFNPNYVGHEPGDPSGKSAHMFEKRFRKYFASYLRSGYKSPSTTMSFQRVKRKTANGVFK